MNPFQQRIWNYSMIAAASSMEDNMLKQDHYPIQAEPEWKRKKCKTCRLYGIYCSAKKRTSKPFHNACSNYRPKFQ